MGSQNRILRSSQQEDLGKLEVMTMSVSNALCVVETLADSHTHLLAMFNTAEGTDGGGCKCPRLTFQLRYIFKRDLV